MASEVSDLINQSWPLISAAVAGYGTAVLKTAQDSAANATVTRGRQILQRIFGTKNTPQQLEDYARDQKNVSFEDALRTAISRALIADPQALRQVRQIMASETMPLDQPSSGSARYQINSNTIGTAVLADHIDTLTIRPDRQD